MNYFNHKNVQLAYEAVYNQDLCESMEDLGLIDGYDYFDEGYKRMTKNKLDRMEDKLGKKWEEIRTIDRDRDYYDRPSPEYKNLDRQMGVMRRVIDDFSGLTRRNTVAGRKPIYGPAISKAKERKNRERGRERGLNASYSYDLYDTILEYLIQEGYADTLGSAEIILENMSEDWIEDIVEGVFDFLPKSRGVIPGRYGQNTVLSMKRGVEGVSDKTKPGTFSPQKGGWDATAAQRYSDAELSRTGFSNVNQADRRVVTPSRIR